MKRRRIAIDAYCAVLLPAIVVALHAAAAPSAGETAVLTMRATYASGAAAGAPLEITLFRWLTDAERAPLLAALSTAPPPREAAPPPAAGRGGRGGRGAVPPLTPMGRLEAAIKAAPT